MATAKKKNESVALELEAIERRYLNLNILGTSPFIFHAMSMKAKQELLYPKGKKTTSEYSQRLKHDPYQEFRDSVYQYRDEEEEGQPTKLMVPARMFKAAISEAAKMVPGVTGTGVKKLVWVEGENIPIFGIPEIRSDVVRNSDFNRTPDIRTRATLRHWVCQITISYVIPQMNADAVGRLTDAAGKLNGIGDYRQERGSGNFGQFELVNEDNDDFQKILQIGGQQAQIAAMEDPRFYDQETEELITWFEEERKRRFEESKAKPKKTSKKNSKADESQPEAV